MARKKKAAAGVLEAAMKGKGWGAVRTAQESGVDVTLIRRYLSGDVDIGLRNAPKLAAALDVSVVELLYGEHAA